MTLTSARIVAMIALMLIGLMAAVFYAYSSSVMLGLDSVGGTAAIAVMQAINIDIQNPVFFMTFFGAPVAAFASGALFWAAGWRTTAYLMIAAGLAYVLGVFLPTAVVNVPMNDALAALLPPLRQAAIPSGGFLLGILLGALDVVEHGAGGGQYREPPAGRCCHGGRQSENRLDGPCRWPSYFTAPAVRPLMM